GRGSRSGTPAAASVTLALALLLAHSRLHRPQPRLQLVAARTRGAPAGRAQQLACLRLLPVLGEQRHLRDARLVPGGAARWARVARNASRSREASSSRPVATRAARRSSRARGWRSCTSG